MSFLCIYKTGDYLFMGRLRWQSDSVNWLCIVSRAQWELDVSQIECSVPRFSKNAPSERECREACRLLFCCSGDAPGPLIWGGWGGLN